MASMAWWLNLATFLGIAILAVPVWSLNTRKRKLHQVRQADADAGSDSDFRTRTRRILVGQAQEERRGLARDRPDLSHRRLRASPGRGAAAGNPAGVVIPRKDVSALRVDLRTTRSDFNAGLKPSCEVGDERSV